MKTPALVLLALALLAFSSCKKDSVTESYLRGGNALINTTDGNMLIAGYNIGGNGSFDGYLLKVSQAGDVLWSNSYGSTNTDALYGLINATGGGYVATGFINTEYDNHPNLVLLKTSDQGDKQWLTTLGDTSFCQGFGVAATSDGGYIGCGYIQKNLYSDRDIYLVKVNSEGVKVWAKKYGSKGASYTDAINDEAYNIIPDGDSAFYVTGSYSGNVSCCGKTFLMKINSAGDSLWTIIYDLGIGFSMVLTSDRNIVIGGSDAGNGTDISMLKTDAMGVKIWKKTFGSTGFDFGTKVIQTADGGYAITGTTTNSSTSEDIVLIKTDASGSSVWTKTFGGSSIEQGYGLVQHDDGGYSIAGTSNTGGSFIYLNRTDANGVETWQKNLK